jgi:hypothetical protein
MPLQNRVTPEGLVVATPARGTMFGVRGGGFHRHDRTLKARHWASKQWICCVLEFKGRRRALMQPGRFTELFFLDEATAFAAGHRPCFECRRADAIRFAELWSKVHGGHKRAAAPAMDDVLHQQRCSAPGRILEQLAPKELPDGAFVQRHGGPALMSGGRLWPWSFEGYGAAQKPPDYGLPVITPAATIAVMAAGYRPGVHASAAP